MENKLRDLTILVSQEEYDKLVEVSKEIGLRPTQFIRMQTITALNRK